MKRILVIDDEPSIRKALTMGLASDEYQVEVAPDGNTGQLMAAGNRYDVILVDLCLPDTNGLDVIKKVKEIQPDVNIIIITGQGSKETSIEAIQLGVRNYLEKPLSLNIVKNAISQAIRKRMEDLSAMEKKLTEMLDRYQQKVSDPFEEIPMIVHQINNPLSCIKGFAELAMLNLSNSEHLKKYLSNIIKATNMMSRINKELMHLGHHPENGVEEVDVAALVTDGLAMFQDLMNLKEIVVETDFGVHGARLKGNRFELEQVVGNLILNAIEAVEDAPEKFLSITAVLDTSFSVMTIHVRDSGCGIQEEIAEEIFRLYYTTKRNGTGLGLSVVKNIVEKNGWKIRVTSRAGRGTTFSVSLPVSVCGTEQENRVCRVE
jgi:signal transduction histidine kinase